MALRRKRERDKSFGHAPEKRECLCPGEDGGEEPQGMLHRESHAGPLSSGLLFEVSVEDLNRIIISFPGLSQVFVSTDWVALGAGIISQ